MTKTVMFIDDDEAFLEIAKRACKKIPAIAKVVQATDGALALAKIEQMATVQGEAPDTVFVDINMPVLDGFGFLEGLAELRSRHPVLRRMKPIAMLTSSDQERDRKRASELGADAYIVKGAGLAATRDVIASFV